MSLLLRLLFLSVFASFLSACNLTLKSNDGGNISADMPGSLCDSPAKTVYPELMAVKCLAYDANKKVNLTPKPKSGYHFVEWRGSCEGAGACMVSMGMPREVAAIFAPDKADFNIQRAFTDEQNIAYFFSEPDHKIYRWNAGSHYFVKPIDLQGDARDVAYDAGNHKIYVAYSSGTIKKISVRYLTPKINPFANTSNALSKIAVAGDLLFTADYYGGMMSLYDKNGTWQDSRYGVYSEEYLWNPENKRMYFYRDGSSPNDIYYQEIDVAHRKFGAQLESPYHGDYEISHPLRISKDGRYALTGSGDIYNASDLTFYKSIPVSLVDGLWDEQALLTLRGNDTTTLEQWDTSLNKTNIAKYPGGPIALLPLKQDYLVVSRLNGEVQFHTYRYTLDGDGDGVPTMQDAFPEDPAASVDTDGDGYPDQWNDGYSQADSTSGLMLDAFPKDALCQLPEHGTNGVCDLDSRIPDFEPDAVLQDAQNILYFFDRETHTLYRWSITERKYLNPFLLHENATTAAYVAYAGQMFVGYGSGEITRIDLVTGKESAFATTATRVGGLADAGKYLLAQDYSGAWATHYVFSMNGDRLDAREWNYFSREYAWDSNASRVYFFRDDTSPNDLHYEKIDQTTGQIVEQGETPYHGDFQILPPIRVSQDGRQVLLGSGDIYESSLLKWNRSIGLHPVDARWTAGGGVVTLASEGEGSKVVEFGADFKRYNFALYEGTPVAIARNGSGYVIVTLAGKPRFFDYISSNDADNDNVPNAEDAFPLDPAASVDTDNDGYPDQWNDGHDASDSTTGLQLDAFPQESLCHLVEDGLDGVCDIGKKIPDYTPEEIVSGADGITYLFDRDQHVVYRWSASTQSHLNPILLQAGALHIAYVKSANALFAGYDSGAITRIDLLSLKEEAFAVTPLAVNGLADAGKYLSAQDSSGAWATHYVFSMTGELLDSKDWNYYSSAYAWDDVNSRLYFFRDDTSPNDLHYEKIDQETGKIVEEGETPYHGDYSYFKPIRVSLDGSSILLGSGDLYQADGLTTSRALGLRVIDALWLTNGLITISESADGTSVSQFSSDYSLYNEANVAGSPLGIVQYQDQYFVITLNGKPQFKSYVSTNDADADGVLNSEDDFPFDPAASLDTDHDAYADQWNSGKTQADSTTGLSLDEFPDNALCHVPDPGTSTCDLESKIPDYQPEQIVSDETGLIYLFDSESQRIYRWSTSSRMSLSPIFLKGGVNRVAFDFDTNNIFVGYETGTIARIDIASLQETKIASVHGAVYGLKVVGNYLLVQDDSGSWATHYVFSKTGQLTDTKSWNYYSSEYAWDANTSRVYFFRDGTSPNDLHFEKIDQLTGKIVEQGESPYHGDYNIASPIRVSADGRKILLGSGDVYAADGLTHLAGLDGALRDARWLENGIAVIRSDGYSSVFAEYGLEFKSYGQQNLAGAALALVKSGSGLVAVMDHGKPEFVSIDWSNDFDGDGTANAQDAFPGDIAAATDNDGDGAPDAWNAGYGEADSTTGLTLDEFPDDMACQNVSQSIDGVCDFHKVIPSTPDGTLCSQDVLPAADAGGQTEYLDHLVDMIPLCSDWIIVADDVKKQIRVFNARDGRTGARYSLDSSPTHMLLDEDSKKLYVTTNHLGEVISIHLIDGSLYKQQSEVQENFTALAVGADNLLLAKTPGAMVAYDKSSLALKGQWNMSGRLMVYNPERAEIIAAESGYSPSSVYRYLFSLNDGPTLVESIWDLGSNGQDLALSPDHQHLAFAAGGGNGDYGYTIFDINPAQLSFKFGEWDNGAYPESVAFSADSSLLLSKNWSSLLVFSVANHSLLKAFPLGYSCSNIQMSRGSALAYALCGDGYYFSRKSQVVWFDLR